MGKASIRKVETISSDKGIVLKLFGLSPKYYLIVRFEVFTAVTMKNGAEWCLLGCYAVWLL
jgi:hypothetical protein